MATRMRYAVLLDAGSSGTRVHVYHWQDVDTDRHEMKIDFIPGWEEKKTEPGIQSLAPVLNNSRGNGNPVHISNQLVAEDSTEKTTADTGKRVSEYLDPLLNHARKFLPRDRIPHIPLYILATGGMRRHKQEHYNEYMILRDAITAYINKSGFSKPIYDTISGEDEALYGWVAANYVDKHLKPDKVPHGFMEMGGESAQFAVSVDPEDFGSYHGLLRKVEIWDERYMVFVKTWMGLGVDSAWKRHQARLRDSDSVIPLDPCLPKGYAYRLSGSDKIVQGTGDFIGCMKETLSLLGCPDKNCTAGNLCIYRHQKDSVDSDPQSVGCLLRDSETGNPIINFNKNQFCGASVYWHATHGIFTRRTGGASKKEDFSQFWESVMELSKLDWETMKSKRAREKATNYKHLQKGLFTAAMIMSTLFLGFGIPMPPQAVDATRAFAAERAEQALYAAENKVDDAAKKSELASGAFLRAVEEVELANKAVEKARLAEEAEMKKNGPLSMEDAAKHLTECNAIYKAWPNDANRQDVIEVVQAISRADDNLTKSKEAARAAREKTSAAAAAAKVAYDALAKANHDLRVATRSEAELRENETVDAKLKEVFKGQEGEPKYTSVKDADWTLGRVVLHVNDYTPDVRTMRNWTEE